MPAAPFHKARAGGRAAALFALFGVLLMLTSMSLALMRPAADARAAVSGTVAGGATGLSGHVFGAAFPAVAAVAYPPAAQSTHGALDLRSNDKRITTRASSLVSSCDSSGTTNQVLAATCTTTVNDFVLMVNETVIITADRITAKSYTFSFVGNTASDTAGTEVVGLCVRINQSGGCVQTVPSTTSVAVNYPSPHVFGTVLLKTELQRTTHGGINGTGKTVTGLQIELTLEGVGPLSMSVGIADSFIGGVSTPVPTATPTRLPPTPTPTPAPPAMKAQTAAG